MRRNLKKPVALLTAALTAASLLAGCGDSSKEGAGADAGTQVNETDNAGAAAETPARSAMSLFVTFPIKSSFCAHTARSFTCIILEPREECKRVFKSFSKKIKALATRLETAGKALELKF